MKLSKHMDARVLVLSKILTISLIFLPGSIVLFGCSADHSPPSQAAPEVYYTPKSNSTLEAELRSASLTCSSSTTCPENVGMIYSNVVAESARTSIAACTGFLISENVVATNRHCIPVRLLAPEVSCANDLAIRFLQKPGSQGGEIYSCKRLLSFSSQKGVFFADYAFFEVERTGRKPLVVARNGLQDHQRIRSVRVTPIRSDYVRGGVIGEESCQVVLGSMLNLVAATSWSPTGTALGCTAFSGNSGSPVLNENGEVLGILQSNASDKYLATLKDGFLQYGIRPPATLPPHFQFTNLTCVSDPVDNSFVDSRCQVVENYSVFSCVSANDKATAKDLEDRLIEWTDRLPEVFAYNFYMDEMTEAIEARPACVVPKEGNEKIHIKFVTLNGSYGFRKENIETRYKYSVSFKPTLTIDSELKVLPPKFEVGNALDAKVQLEKTGSRWIGKMLSAPQVALNLPDCTSALLEAKAARKSPSFVRTMSGEILGEESYKQLRKQDVTVPRKPHCPLSLQ